MGDINFNKRAVNKRGRGGLSYSSGKPYGDLNCSQQGYNNGQWRFWDTRGNPMCPEEQRTRYPCVDGQCSGDTIWESRCCNQYTWGPECCNLDIYCCMDENCHDPYGGYIENCQPGPRCRHCPPPEGDIPLPDTPEASKQK